MPLYTKSIQVPREQADGIRICVMRKPGVNTEWDIWIPRLAPSFKLLQDYAQGVIGWDRYVQRFHEEVIVGQQEFLELLIDMSKQRVVTILCFETTPEKCHRRLIAEFCAQKVPDLTVIIE